MSYVQGRIYPMRKYYFAASLLILFVSIAISGCLDKYEPDFYENDNDKDFVKDPQDPDDDNDGIPDLWEIQYFLNPNDSSDKHLDQDKDGVDNKNEYDTSTDPTNPLDFSYENDTDTDDDGIPNWWEIKYGTNQYEADGMEDYDWDYYVNKAEFEIGGNPISHTKPIRYEFESILAEITEIDWFEYEIGIGHVQIRIKILDRNEEIRDLFDETKRILSTDEVWIEDYWDIIPRGLEIGEIVELDLRGMKNHHFGFTSWELLGIKIYGNLFHAITAVIITNMIIIAGTIIGVMIKNKSIKKERVIRMKVLKKCNKKNEE